MNRDAPKSRLPLAVAVLGGVTLVSAPAPEPAVASCVGPFIDEVGGALTGRPAVTPGQVIVVTGSAFVDGCDDVSGTAGTVGCSSSEPDDPETPIPHIALRLVQGARHWVLGVADAGSADDGKLGQVEWTVTIPRGLDVGTARLRADSAQAVALRVR